MKKHFLLLAAICFSIAAVAQVKPEKSAKELLIEDHFRAADCHHHYERMEGTETPAPEGYTPFYVSHFGRHGSRYHCSPRDMQPVIAALGAMADKGLLTEAGEQLYADFKTVYAAHDGMYGMLTQRGASEHRGIATRLYERETPIFSQPDRDSAVCVSTPVPRCIVSMANFVFALKEEDPGLKVSYDTGDRYRDYLNAHAEDKKSAGEARDYVKELVSKFNAKRLVHTYFKKLDDKKVGSMDPESFFYEAFKTATISQCLDGDMPDLLSMFNEDELYHLWKIDNVEKYGTMCLSAESNGERDIIAQLIVKDIVEKADRALEDGSRIAADLRFAHDSDCGPLMGLLKLEGNDTRLKLSEADDYWYCFQNVCMATNFQFIFYKNAEGNILVKILHNESERTIPALTPVTGRYYSWTDLRTYLVGLLK